jgi:hypothetical protein
VFTLPDVNENLVRFKSELLTTPAAAAGASSGSGKAKLPPPRVLVPLCGRSVDMNYLAEEGCFVVGVDAVGEALRQWGNDHGGLEPLAADEDAGATVYRSRWYPRLVLIHADFFRLTPDLLGGAFDAVWDRGGMTSIGEGAPRAAYAGALAACLKPGGRLLLEFLSCNLAIDGAMSDKEARAALGAGGFTHVRALARRDVRGQYPAFSPPGLQYLQEEVLVAAAPAEPASAASGSDGGQGHGEGRGVAGGVAAAEGGKGGAGAGALR